jgi:hypothetical protein
LPFTYSVFGLSLFSNVSIPGLNEVRAPAVGQDVEICLGASPAGISCGPAQSGKLTFTSSDRDAAGQPALCIWEFSGGAFLHLAYCDGMKFWLDREGTKIWCTWPDTSSLEDAATYLLGPALGLLLRLRGLTCLHASAVAFGGRAVAFVGEEGAGKSTTAAAFARRGHAVISDDIVALVQRDDAFFVLPAYPYLSLWADSVAMLYGEGKQLPPFSSNWDKRILALAQDQAQFEKNSLPLGAIFILGERTSDEAAPSLEPLTPQEAMLALVANSYATSLLDGNMRAREFSLLGRLLLSVPVQRIRPHESAAQMGKFCDVISAGFAAMQRDHSPASAPG